jgi:REP element-mobilizing transposase RayT
MTFDPKTHHRRSIRLQGYDYSRPGAYFVTICTQNRECLFGQVVDGTMRLNGTGWMIQTVWDELPQFYPGVDIDAFVVMPNHIHGIIVLIVGAGPCACPDKKRQGQPQGVAPTMSLPDVVHRFKSLTTTRYRQGVTGHGWRPFPGKLWQRNYHEHIIRNEDDLNRIRQYIINNPARWAEDENNSDNWASSL